MIDLARVKERFETIKARFGLDISVYNVEAGTPLNRGYVIEEWRDIERHIEHFMHLIIIVGP